VLSKPSPNSTGKSHYEMDCANVSLLALATAARNYHLVKPIMTDRPVLEINEGRHLIQEQLVHTYVTNDTLLQGGYQEDGDSDLNSMVCSWRCPELAGAGADR
jgi:DNA mismatch repair ATPase MutS